MLNVAYLQCSLEKMISAALTIHYILVSGFNKDYYAVASSLKIVISNTDCAAAGDEKAACSAKCHF